MHLPTVKQLRYLVALDEHRHFGHAAQACHISQSGFSIAIKELEELLQIRLVDRTNKSVTITSVGKQVVAKARLCLREMENLVELPDTTSEPLSGRLNIGIIPTIAPYLLPAILKGAKIKFPKLKLYLKEQITSLLYDELMTGHIDLMLVALPYDFKHTEQMSLFKDYFLLAHHRDTKWLNHCHSPLKQLKEESVLLLSDGHCLRAHTLSACKLMHSDKINQFAGTSMHTLLYMVDNDLGVTFIPEMAKHLIALTGLNLELQTLDEDSYREIGLVWRKNSSYDAEFRLFGEFIKTSAEQNGLTSVTQAH